MPGHNRLFVRQFPIAPSYFEYVDIARFDRRRFDQFSPFLKQTGPLKDYSMRKVQFAEYNHSALGAYLPDRRRTDPTVFGQFDVVG